MHKVLQSRNTTDIVHVLPSKVVDLRRDFILVFCFSRGSSSGNCLQLAHKTQTLADRKQETISVQKEMEEDKKWPVLSHR